MATFLPPPPAAVTRVLSHFNRQQLEGFVAVAIDLMDLADGDPDLESDPCNEDDAGFDPASRQFVDRYSDGPGDAVSGDAEPAAWVERVDQSKGIDRAFVPWSLGNTEDAEDDDGVGEVTDDEPGFGKQDRAIANLRAFGPGCSIADPPEDGRDAEIETWADPQDCPDEVFIGQRRPARQLDDE